MAGKTETYNDTAWIGSWRQRAAGIWSGAIIGIIFGALTGALAPLAPVVIGALSTSALPGVLASTVPVFASWGMVTGVVAGGLVGCSSGGVAAIAEEQDRRQEKIAEAAGLPLPPSKQFEKPVEQSKGIISKIASYINPRAMLIFTGLGLAGGLLYTAAAVAGAGGLAAVGAEALASSMPGISAVTSAVSATAAPVMGLAASTAAALSYCVAGVAAFGAIFGFRFAHMTNDMRNVTAAWLSNKFGDKPAQEQAPALQPARAMAIEAPAIDVSAQVIATEPAISHASQHAPRAQEGYREMAARIQEAMNNKQHQHG